MRMDEESDVSEPWNRSKNDPNPAQPLLNINF